ncbi:MAG: hypothetical protein HKN16_02350 [Saprospiraceae bacterium]|nr:hypothetical protein [Saprospiraceae bacterium]
MRKSLIITSILFFFFSLPDASGQVELEKMEKLRAGIIKLRQACLDSLHKSVFYLGEMRDIIENTPAEPPVRAMLLNHYLGEPIPAEYQRKYGPSGTYRVGNPWANHGPVRSKHMSLEDMSRLNELRNLYLWPKIILQKLASYGQLEKEYPHKMTGSNFFYGLLSFFDFKNQDEIVVFGGEESNSIGVMLALYLEDSKIFTTLGSLRFPIKFFESSQSGFVAPGTRLYDLEGPPKSEDLFSKDRVIMQDLFAYRSNPNILREARDWLKTGGELCLIEKSKGNLKNNVKYDNLLSKNRIIRRAKKAGLQIKAIEDLKHIRLFRFVAY